MGVVFIKKFIRNTHRTRGLLRRLGKIKYLSPNKVKNILTLQRKPPYRSFLISNFKSFAKLSLPTRRALLAYTDRNRIKNDHPLESKFNNKLRYSANFRSLILTSRNKYHKILVSKKNKIRF